MKSKWIAAGLAFLGGSWGVHKFYLKQPELGLLYIGLKIFISFSLLGLSISGLLGFYDAFKLIMMTDDEFNQKYNSRNYKDRYGNRRKETPNQNKRQGKYILLDEDEVTTQRSQTGIFDKFRKQKEAETLKQAGIRKLKDYDINSAIENFTKALEKNSDDFAIHFNLACAYSMNENALLAFKHLDLAVSLGFKEGSKIINQDELAYIRIIPTFEKFRLNQFRLTQEMVEEIKSREINLLEEIKKQKEKAIPEFKSSYSTLFQEQLREDYK
ncbi:MAG: TM2 domain-containing protein [Saprospiraceae bacterium]